MSSDAELRRDAADALSHILSSHNIAHAWIGGFALQALGATRNTTDIDIEIDVPSVDDIHSRIGPMIVSADPRFSIHNLKLYFTASGSDCLTPRRVPIETLPIGSLNLPRRLQVVPDATLPVLKPGILILTKMKRACHLIGSTRPQSQSKLNTDIVDITFLVNLLVQSRDKIDFTGYDAQFPERLYVAARVMLDYFRANDLALAEKLEACFEAADCDRITG